jgi:hypothetical protein
MTTNGGGSSNSSSSSTQCPFTVSLSKTALSHVKPAFDGTSLDNSLAQGQDEICNTTTTTTTTIYFIGYLWPCINAEVIQRQMQHDYEACARKWLLCTWSASGTATCTRSVLEVRVPPRHAHEVYLKCEYHRDMHTKCTWSASTTATCTRKSRQHRDCVRITEPCPGFETGTCWMRVRHAVFAWIFYYWYYCFYYYY